MLGAWKAAEPAMCGEETIDWKSSHLNLRKCWEWSCALQQHTVNTLGVFLECSALSPEVFAALMFNLHCVMSVRPSHMVEYFHSSVTPTPPHKQLTLKCHWPRIVWQLKLFCLSPATLWRIIPLQLTELKPNELEDSLKLNSSIDASDPPCFSQIIWADVCKKNRKHSHVFSFKKHKFVTKTHKCLFTSKLK